MSLAAFLPLRSPYPHQRSPPDTFSPRVNFSPRPVLAPMSRIPRIETASRRANDLPRDPSDWVDKDLLSYVRYNYSPVEAVPLSEVIERDRLTPTALWYLQAEPEQLLAIAEEESLRNTLLGLALSLKPAVSPTTPRIRHVRRLSEDLERPPPPPPPPPPSPPTPEEPELEEDDDVAESIVSDWALDEDLDSDHGPTPTMDDLGDLAGSAAQPEPPLEGLGLHTGEPHLDDVTTPQPQPMPMDTDDLINLEDDPQPNVPQEEAPEPHPTRTDTGAADDAPVEELTSSQSTSTDAHVPDVTEEKPAAATHHADPSAPSDEPSASREAGAGMPADPFAGSNSFTSPIEDDDLGDPWAEDTSGPDSSPPPRPADPPRTSTPTSDYHDANSTHSDQGERREAPPAEQEPEPSPVHPQERDGPTTSGDEHQPITEVPLPAETPVQGESGENASSGEDPPTREEVQPENPAPASSDPVQPPPPAADPVQTPPPATDLAQTPPPATDPAQPSPSVTDPVPPPAQETTQTQEEHVSSAVDPVRDETAHVGSDDSKDTQSEPPVQSTTTTSGIPASDQSEETVEAEERESGHPGGEEAVDKDGEDEEATVPSTTTIEPAETPAPPAATADTVDKSPASEESSEGEASGTQVNEQPSTTEPSSVHAEAEAQDSSSPTQSENAPERPSIQLEAPAIEITPLSSLTATTTTTTTMETAVSNTPPSPTIVLISGVEAQLVFRDPESTEQTPSASPSDTPPNASPSPSESRQASPSAETEPEKPAPPATRVRIPSSPSSVSSVNSTEKKALAPLEPIKTAFEPAVRRTAATPTNTTSRSGSFGPERSAWNQVTSAAPKTPAWGSAAQSPAGKAKSLFSSITSSVSSFAFGSHSEPTTRNASQEREPPAPRTLAPSIRQHPGAGQGPWAQKRDWAAVPSSPTSSQQSSKSSLPPPPAVESSGNASPARVPRPTPGKPASTPEASPPEESETQKTDREGKREATEALSDSIIVDSGMPSAENGEPARNEEASRDPLVQPSATPGGSPDADKASGQNDANGAEDEDLVNITPHDVAEASKEAGSEPQTQGGLIGGEDDDDDAPLDRRLARVRQITGDSISSAVTSDAETQGEDERLSRPKGPKVETTDLLNETEGVDSPVVDSPVVGSPSTTTSAAERKRQKKARQRTNKLTKGL